MSLYTIIVTYNGSQWIQKCIQSLVDSSIKTEIIVIDNGSSDGTQDIIKSFPSIQFIQSETNLGFGKSNNIGINIALENSADYVFLLNQDAWIEKDTLKSLLNVLSQHEKIGVASPIHLNGEGTSLDKLFGTYVAPKLSNDPCLFMSDSYTQQLAEYYEVDFVNAAAWLLSRECIEKIGLFDPLFYHYGEDVNYCQRLNYFNYKLAIVPNSKIYHDRGDRIIKKDNSQNFKFRSLLLELSDPNKTDIYIAKRFKYLKKLQKRAMLVDLLKGRWTKMRESHLYIQFLNENKTEILDSRIRNSRN